MEIRSPPTCELILTTSPLQRGFLLTCYRNLRHDAEKFAVRREFPSGSNVVDVEDAGQRFDRGADAGVDAEAAGQRHLDLAARQVEHDA